MANVDINPPSLPNCYSQLLLPQHTDSKTNNCIGAGVPPTLPSTASTSLFRANAFSSLALHFPSLRSAPLCIGLVNPEYGTLAEDERGPPKIPRKRRVVCSCSRKCSCTTQDSVRANASIQNTKCVLVA